MQDWLGRKLLNERVRTVFPHLQGRVLDIGCGTNELIGAYRQAGKDTGASDSVGVDVYPWHGTDLVVEDSAMLPFESRSFDTVTIIAALNHIPNRRDVLAEVRRLVRTDGRFVVTMIPPGLSRVWHFLRSPWDVDQSERGMQPGEVYGISRKEIFRLLARSGFVVSYEERFMLGLNHLTISRPA